MRPRFCTSVGHGPFDDRTDAIEIFANIARNQRFWAVVQDTVVMRVTRFAKFSSNRVGGIYEIAKAVRRQHLLLKLDQALGISAG